jgi:hypothetical protein
MFCGMNFRWLRLLPMLFLLAAVPAGAQVSGGGAPGVSAGFAKLFGSHTAFTAKVEAQVLDRTQKEFLRLPMTFAALDGRIRVDIDLAEMRSQVIPASAIASYKQTGLNRVTSIVRPEQKAMFIIYPGVQSYVNVPMSKAEAEASGANLQVQRTRLGEETVDNYPCVQHRVVVKNNKGDVVLEAVTWNATTLKGFPVRIATQENGNTTVMRFQQVQFVKPDLKQFAPVAGYAKYSSVDGLMFAAAKKAEGTTGQASTRQAAPRGQAAPAKR